MDINKKNTKGIPSHNVCVVGIGNPLRGDDGVGSLACHYLEKKKLRNTDIITVHQLDPVMAENLSLYDVVIFADAAVTQPEEVLIEAVDSETKPVSFSHHVNMPVLAGLCKKLYSSKARFFYCAIKASDFEHGSPISPATRKNVEKAAEAIFVFIQKIRD